MDLPMSQRFIRLSVLEAIVMQSIAWYDARLLRYRHLASILHSQFSIMITTLPDRIANLPQDIRRACERIFRVALIAGYTDPPPTMHAWVEQHFGSVDAVREQTVVRVVNFLTL
jgi:hypothetical protein